MLLVLTTSRTRWASQEAFAVAVANDGEAQASRLKLEAFGRSNPALFTEVFRVTGGQAPARDYPSTHFWRDFQQQHIEIDGLKLHVVTGGQGEPILLIPGFPKTWAIWHRALPVLAKRYRVIAPDLRGFGGSQGTGSGYDKKTLSLDMERLLDSLEVERAHVVGHDFGGQIAYALAAHRPDRVATLTIIESLLPGIPVKSRGDEGRFWLIPFHLAPGVAEMLTAGREGDYVRKLWDVFGEPDSEVTQEDRAEMARAFAQPAALAAGFELYRSIAQDIADLSPHYSGKLVVPVLALGVLTALKRGYLRRIGRLPAM